MRISDENSPLGDAVTKYDEHLHPRGFHGHWIVTNAERRMQSTPIHVTGTSVFGKGPHVADFQSFSPDGKHATVRLHLDDSHPAVQQTIADMPHMHPDNFEFIDTVPTKNVEMHGEDPIALGEQHARELAAHHDRMKREAVVADNQARLIAARQAVRRQPLPTNELDHGLRTKPLRKEETIEDDLELSVTKSSDEQRYTFGPLYAPGMIDAHGEFVTADHLQKAVWDFARNADRVLRKQHDRDQKIGHIVEQVAWPFPQDVELSLPDGTVKKTTLPAGTVYAGVIWDESAWPDVKSGKITGLSLGGRALRVRGASLPEPTDS